jgi:hypothetical protein
MESMAINITARHDYWGNGKGIFKTQEMSLIA